MEVDEEEGAEEEGAEAEQVDVEEEEEEEEEAEVEEEVEEEAQGGPAAAAQNAPPAGAQGPVPVREPIRLVQCPICMDALPDRLAYPCGHPVCCGCAPQVGRKCPICKQTVKRHLQIRFT